MFLYRQQPGPVCCFFIFTITNFKWISALRNIYKNT